jgi:hypothetical protein
MAGRYAWLRRFAVSYISFAMYGQGSRLVLEWIQPEKQIPKRLPELVGEPALTQVLGPIMQDVAALASVGILPYAPQLRVLCGLGVLERSLA